MRQIAHPEEIRVLITDDSAFMRTALTRLVQSDPELVVVSTARDGTEALEAIRKAQPDVMTLDLEMPRLGGLELLRVLRQQGSSLPVIVVSSLTSDGAAATLEAFELGAFECIPKPLSYACLDIVNIRDDLVAKIKAAANCENDRQLPVALPITKGKARSRQEAAPLPLVIAIGISTGGPKALHEMLPRLPADFPVPILIVQHMPPGFTQAFAQRLNHLSPMAVSEARDGQGLEPGNVMIAPGGKHMILRQAHTRMQVRISSEPNHTLHVPSVDVMMRSVAECCHGRSLGLIMTGMGSDGMQGMQAIAKAGGFTIGQSAESCTVYGMPRACAELGLLKRVVDLKDIPDTLLWAVGRERQTSVFAAL